MKISKIREDKGPDGNCGGGDTSNPQTESKGRKRLPGEVEVMSDVSMYGGGDFGVENAMSAFGQSVDCVEHAER